MIFVLGLCCFFICAIVLALRSRIGKGTWFDGVLVLLTVAGGLAMVGSLLTFLWRTLP